MGKETKGESSAKPRPLLSPGHETCHEEVNHFRLPVIDRPLGSGASLCPSPLTPPCSPGTYRSIREPTAEHLPGRHEAKAQPGLWGTDRGARDPVAVAVAMPKGSGSREGRQG